MEDSEIQHKLLLLATLAYAFCWPCWSHRLMRYVRWYYETGVIARESARNGWRHRE